ncbi:MAG: transcriptional repressor [Flavobacteriales bacterium]|nr:transcriptional repressor [Flavobacteriales bacterium]
MIIFKRHLYKVRKISSPIFLNATLLHNHLFMYFYVMGGLKEILKKHNLKYTENRKVILEQFLSTNYALSYNEIDSLIEKKIDKVTVYRTLKSFEENGIVHQVVDGSNQIKYALCHHESCSSDQHYDTHIHFKCIECDKTYCLNDIRPPKLKLPKGYSMDQQNVFIQGLCNYCN